MVPKRNRYKELLTAYIRGQRSGMLKHRIRKALAEHQRLLRGIHEVKSGVRRHVHHDGLIIKTWISNFGRYPILKAAIVAFPGGEGVIFLENEFVLERGLVIADGFDFRVHIGDALEVEWLGNPPVYSWGNDEHPQGELSLLNTVCSAGAKIPTWTGAEAGRSYVSRATPDQLQAWSSDAIRDSCRYSGLLKLLVEGWGPHEAFNKLQPGDWPTWTSFEAGNRGLIRVRDDAAQTYRWFLIYIGSTLGCRAVELTPHESVRCLVAELYSGSLPVAQRLITESWILRKLELQQGQEQIALISSFEYEQTVIGFALMHGWKFPHQKFGTLLESTIRADIVVLQYEEDEPSLTNWYNTRHCRLDFNFNGMLSASLSVADQGTMRFNFRRHPFWQEIGTKLVCRAMPTVQGQTSLAPPDLSDVTPIYCIGYDDEGVDLLRYHKYEVIPEPGEPEYDGSILTACVEGPTVSEDWFTEAAVTIVGGWSSNSVDATKKLIVGKTTEFEKTFNLVNTGAIIDVPVRYLTCPDGVPCESRPSPDQQREAVTTANNHSCITGSVDDEFDRVLDELGPNVEFLSRAVGLLQGAKGTLYKEKRGYSDVEHGGHCVIVPEEEAEAIIIVSGLRGYDLDRQSPGANPIHDRIADAFQCENNLDYFIQRGAFIGGRVKILYRATYFNNDRVCFYGPDWHYQFWNSCFNNDFPGGCQDEEPYETVEQLTVEDHAISNLVFRGGTIPLDERFSVWKDLVNTTQDVLENNWNPFIRMQYGGNVLYQTKPEARDENIKSNAGYDQSAIDAGDRFRFVSS